MRSPRPFLPVLVLTALACFAAPAAAQSPPEPPAAVVEEAIGAAPAVADSSAEAAGKKAGKRKGGDNAPTSGGVTPSKLEVKLRGLKGGRLDVGEGITATGTLRPFAKGEKVTMILKRGKKTVKRKTMFVERKGDYGRFKLSDKLVKPGRYRVEVVHTPSANLAGSRDRSRSFKIRYPDLRSGNRSSKVALLNRLLAKQRYAVDKGKKYGGATERAVLAFRKVNGMSRTTKASGSIFKKLAKGKGGYKLKYPGSGKHVEIDISRQVMVLAKGKKIHRIYHVSTGAPATPTYPGTWRFYRKEPGYNSLEMYYSVYYNRGYATHGYKSVPTYPASHGCTRNPPSDAKHIYDWIDIGDLVHVYN